jgi:hypothetical protein
MTLDGLFNNVKRKANDYFAPTQNIRARDIIRELPSAVGKTFNSLSRGNLGQDTSRGFEQFQFFKPTEQVRTRDFVRELPMGIDKTIQGVAQGVARFGISLAELQKTFQTGKASGQFYNTPFGRINSFQSEAQNRVNRGDPLWKAIGNPTLDTILAGADIGAITAPVLASLKNAKRLDAFGDIGKEIRALSADLTIPLGKTMKMTIPSRTEMVSPNIFDNRPGIGTFKVVNGKLKKVDGFRMTRNAQPFDMPEMQVDVPFQFQSKTLNAKPGMTIKAVGATNSNNIADDIAQILGEGKQVKRRGFIQTIKDSEKTPPTMKDIEGIYTPKTVKEMQQIAKEFISSNPEEALQRAFNPQSELDIRIGDSLINHYIGIGDITRAKEVGKKMSESGTEFGRAVQAFSDYDKTTPEGALRFAQSTVNKYNNANPTKKIDISNDQIKALFERARVIQEMAIGRERNIAAGQLYEQVQNLIPSSIGDKFITVWKAGLLTSLRTHERNIIGNTMHTGAEITKDFIASPLDKLMSLRTGQRTKTFTMKGIGSGAKEGLKDSKDVLRYGFDPEEAIQKYDVRHITWGKNKIEQALKSYTNAVFRTLGAADKPFYQSTMARSLYDQATAQAINAGKKGDINFIKNLVENATEEMKMIAVRDASIATFKNETTMGKAIQAVKREFGTTHVVNGVRISGKIPGFITEMIAPFTGVPSAIASQMAAYSPIGLIKGIYKTGKVMVKNLPELQRLASEELARGIVGTGIMGLGAYLTSKGLMTGNPKDAKEARQWQLEGKQANSIMINGKWRSINSVGPEALITLAGSKLQSSETSGKAIANIGKDFMSQTFLQGVQGPLNAINEPNRYAQTYAKGQISSVVPNIIKDVSSSFDPLQRETNSIKEGLQSAIPGIRNTLLPRRDALGTSLPNEKAGIASFVDLFNSKTPVHNPIVDELSRLNLVDYNSVPSAIQKNQTILGEKIKLTPVELDTLEEQSGNALRDALGTLVSSPIYQSLSNEEKQARIQSVVAEIRKKAKIDYKLGTPEVSVGASVSNLASKDMVPAGNGKVYVPALDKEFANEDLAKFAVAKEEFINSDKNMQIIGNKVLRKATDGTITTQKKNIYDTQVIGQKLERAKKNNDIEEWLTIAEEKLKKLQSQFDDPNTDELEKETIMNDMEDLYDKYQKYKGYGGFKKSKEGKKIKAPAEIKIDFSSVDIPKPIKMVSTVNKNIDLPNTSKTAIKISPKVKIKKINLKRSISTIPGSKRLA